MPSTGPMDVQKEATCPVCQELLTQDLSLGCGHHVCQACLTMNQSAVINPGGKSSCPVCGTRFSFENLQANKHLADGVERLREVKLNPDIGEKRDLCVHHGEKLLLFCKEDKKVICWVCERSQEHRGHHTFLRDEAVRECQENLQKALKRLRKEQEKVETLEADIKEDRISWKAGILSDAESYFRMTFDSHPIRPFVSLHLISPKLSDKLLFRDEGREHIVVNTHTYLKLITKVNCIMSKAGRVFVLLFPTEALTVLQIPCKKQIKKK